VIEAANLINVSDLRARTTDSRRQARARPRLEGTAVQGGGHPSHVAPSRRRLGPKPGTVCSP
jgi:hypothetical protein